MTGFTIVFIIPTRNNKWSILFLRSSYGNINVISERERSLPHKKKERGHYPICVYKLKCNYVYIRNLVFISKLVSSNIYIINYLNYY